MKLQERAGKKRTSPKTDLLMRRLTAYSATAGAALLVAPVADAAIYNITTFSNNGGAFDITPPDVIASSLGHFYSIQFVGAPVGYLYGFSGKLGVSRFTNPTAGGGVANGGYAGISANFTSVLATRLRPTSNAYIGARRLAFGATIAGGSFTNGPLSFALKSTTFSGKQNIYGSFLSSGNNATKTGYIGFRYGTSYYGWLRVKVVNDGTGSPVEVTLADKNGDGIYGALGSVSDNIKAGEIAGVPEPSVAGIGGLGLLALGAAGLRELRRRRKAQPTV